MVKEVTVKFLTFGNMILRDIVCLSDIEHQKYLKRDFPITDVYGDMFHLDENDFIHRDGNLPAQYGKNTGTFYARYIVHGLLHRTNGPAKEYLYNSPVFCHNQYFLNGHEYTKEEWKSQFLKKIFFSRKNKNTIRKLLYIPELYQNVFYANKHLFISLLQKI